MGCPDVSSVAEARDQCGSGSFSSQVINGYGTYTCYCGTGKVCPSPPCGGSSGGEDTGDSSSGDCGVAKLDSGSCSLLEEFCSSKGFGSLTQARVDSTGGSFACSSCANGVANIGTDWDGVGAEFSENPVIIWTMIGFGVFAILVALMVNFYRSFTGKSNGWRGCENTKRMRWSSHEALRLCGVGGGFEFVKAFIGLALAFAMTVAFQSPEIFEELSSASCVKTTVGCNGGPICSTSTSQQSSVSVDVFILSAEIFGWKFLYDFLIFSAGFISDRTAHKWDDYALTCLDAGILLFVAVLAFMNYSALEEANSDGSTNVFLSYAKTFAVVVLLKWVAWAILLCCISLVPRDENDPVIENREIQPTTTDAQDRL